MSRKKELSMLSKEELIKMILQKEKIDRGAEKKNIENGRKRPCSSSDKGPPPKRGKFEKKQKKKKRPFVMDRYHQRRIALKVAYLGHSYHGFVVQDDTENTIEHQLFSALKVTRLITDIESADYSRAGRTDKGVSSLGNVIALNVRSKLCFGKGFIPKPSHKLIAETENVNDATAKEEEEKGGKEENGCSKEESPNNNDDISAELDYVGILNKVLPRDIRILSWCPVDLDFSARFQCQHRRYKYLFYRNGMDIDAMREASKLLVGTHDFRNFCKMDVVNVNNFVREIYAVSIEALESESESMDLDDLWSVDISGSAFLWHQIRFMMAVLFRIGKGEEEVSVISDLLDIEKCDGKPQYLMASHLPLVLYDCAFHTKDADFGGNNIGGVDTAVTLRMLWRESNLESSVQRLFWKHCEDRMGDDGKEREILDTEYRTMPQVIDPRMGIRKRGKKKGKKLMEMEREPGLGERLDTMQNSKLRKYRVKESLRAHFLKNKNQNDEGDS